MPAIAIGRFERVTRARARADARDRRAAVPRWRRLAQRLLVVGVFFSGWSLLRVGQINLTLSDLAILASFSLFALQGQLSLRPFGPLTPYWILGLTLMLGGLFVSSIINGDPLRWLNIASQYLVAFLLVPILLMQQDDRTARSLSLAFLLGTTLSEVIGIAASLLLTYHDTLRWLGDGFITGNNRLGAMAGQPNPNGAMVAFSFPMLIYTLRRGAIPWWVGLSCGLVLTWGLMLSASFTGFFASVMAVLATLTLMGARYMIRLGMIGLVAAGLFVASGSPLPKAFQTRVGAAVEAGDIQEAGTFVNRSDLIREAWGMAEHNSVIGLGADRYRDISAYDNPVHDLYLLVWNEGGCVAFVGLVTLLLLLLVLAAAGLRRNRDAAAMAVAVATVFLIYTVSYPHMYSRMWTVPVLVALSVIYARRFGAVAPRA
jgi:O-antigen ligase